MKYFLLKLKDVGLSLLPVFLVVLVLHFSFGGFNSSTLINFVIACLIIVIGEILFLSGVEGSIMQMGDLVGNSVNKFSKFIVVLFFAFIFGLFATIAEPDLHVLGTQIQEFGLVNIPKMIFIFIVGAGVGIFVVLALFRIIKNVNYKLVIFAIFVCIFILTIFVPDSLIAIAFDAGGATTGIITSPFLLALSVGIAKNKSKVSHSDNFGVIGIASTGPILAVLFVSVIFAGSGNNSAISESTMNIFIETLIDASLAIIPLVLVFFIFEAIFLKVSKKKKIGLIIGSMITFVGLYLFLFGINFGMISMGEEVGLFLATKSSWFSIIVSLVLGFLITFTEPSVRVLGSQVEDVTQGNIRRSMVTVAIAIAMMIAVSLSTMKIIFNISIWWIIGIGYGLILLLMPFSNTTFVSIAFDSGGVASGPMSAAFILPLMIGFASKNGGAVEGFGLIAIVGMVPILVLEILGVIYKIKINAHSTKEYKRALRISYGLDMYSNIDSLEEAYNRRKFMESMKKEREDKKQEELILATEMEIVNSFKGGSDGDIEG